MEPPAVGFSHPAACAARLHLPPPGQLLLLPPSPPLCAAAAAAAASAATDAATAAVTSSTSALLLLPLTRPPPPPLLPQIAESLTRYGINADSRHLLVARFDATDEDLERIRATVQGSEAPLAELPGLTNTELLSKYYKVVGPELKVGSLGDAALVRIAARDC